MFQKPKKMYRCCILILVIILLCSCGGKEMRAKKEIDNLLAQIDRGNLHLTIYYFDPAKFTLLPVSIDSIVNGGCDYKCSIDDTSLSEQNELFGQLKNASLALVEQESRVDARIYYIFEDNKDRKILDICMWGDNDSIYINGVEYQWDVVFYNIIRPFLTDDLTEYMDKQCEAIMQSKN